MVSGDKLSTPCFICRQVITEFFNKDSEELYYFLGFVAADGYLTDNEIEIGINENDVCLLEKFRDLIVPDKPLYYRKRTHSYTLKISCKSLMNDFKNFYVAF